MSPCDGLFSLSLFSVVVLNEKIIEAKGLQEEIKKTLNVAAHSRVRSDSCDTKSDFE